MPTITFNTGILDTSIWQADPATSYGSKTRVEIDDGTGVEVQGLLAFTDVFGTGAGQIPLGATITSASLTLQTTNGSQQGASLHRMLVGWDEQSTWSSLNNGVTPGTETVQSADAVTGAVAIGSRSFDVTQSVQAWAGGAANYGWLFDPRGTDGWDFTSSEGSVKPVLSVTYETSGEPPPASPPVASIENVSAAEDAGVMTFTVTLDKAAGPGGATVNYATVNDTAGADDFVAASGSVVFDADDLTKTISISLTDDGAPEAAETFRVQLSSPVNVTLSQTKSAATGTIQDNDSGGGAGEFATVSFSQGVGGYAGLADTFIQQASPTASAGGLSRLEVDGGSGVTIQSLLAFNDIFGSGAGLIPYGATITSASLTLQTTNASGQGGSLHRMTTNWDEQSTWASLVDGVGIGSDAIGAADLATGAVTTGSRSFDVTQSLQAWSDGQANKGWVFNPGGTDGWDFTSSEGSIKPVLNVTYWTGGTPPPATPPVVSIAAGTPNPQTEGEGAPITFNVSLSKAWTSVVTVDYATSNGSASSSTDYNASSGTITFQPGDTSESIIVTLKDDSSAESSESFNVALTSPVNASLGTASAVGNIRDNDSTSTGWPATDPVLVRATDTSIGGPNDIGAVDPAGIAWVPARGSTPGRLYVSDSEVDESPYNSSYNLFALNLDGSPQSNFEFDLRSFTREPTGLSYNPNTHVLYVSDDDNYKIFAVDPANPTSRSLEFDARRAGATDPEDIAVDPSTGNIYITNGTPSHKITEVTSGGSFVREYVIPSVVQDMEALAYDDQHEVFLVGGGFSSSIWVVNKSGAIVDTIDLSAYRNPLSDTKVAVKDMTFAPTSSTSDDPSLMNLYVADYGETHTSDANDGRILEIDLGWHLVA